MTNSNVTPITDRQPAPAARFTITATIDGFPVSIEVEGKADALRGMIDRLKAIGATPPTATSAEQLAAKVGVPVCPTHNVPMMASTKRNGSYFCPKKADDGGYCRHKA